MNIAQSAAPILPVDVYCVDLLGRNSGIYFLFNEDSLIYIGQAKNVHTRVEQHYAERSKEFTLFSWLLVPENDLNEVEASYIAAYAPPLNRSVPPNSRYKPRRLAQSECWKRFRRHATDSELKRWALPPHLKTGGAEPSYYYDLVGLFAQIAATKNQEVA